MTEFFSNFYASLLQGAISNSATSLVVASAIGAPAANFRLTIQDAEADTTNREILLVTAKAGDTFTVTRGAEGTTAVAHANGSFIAHTITAGSFQQAILDRVTLVQSTILVTIDGGDGSIIPGVKLDLTIDFAAIIESWTILADRVGSIVIDVWKDTYANFPPTVADTITGSEKPTIASGALKATSDVMTGWNGVINPGEILRFNVDSCSAIVKATLSLRVTRT